MGAVVKLSDVKHNFGKEKNIIPGVLAVLSDDGDRITVNWFGRVVLLPLEEIKFTGTSLEEMCTSLLRHLSDMLDVGEAEYKAKGGVAYTAEGTKFFTLRGDLVKYISRNRNFAYPPAPLRDSFDAKVDGSLVVVRSVKGTHLPHEAVAHGSAYLRELTEGLIDINEDTTTVALSSRPEVPVVVGHIALIERLVALAPHLHKSVSVSDLDSILPINRMEMM